MGHPMLGVRATVALLQCITTMVLVVSGINWSQTVPLAMMQLVSACTLFAQWDRSGRDYMYVVRGCASLARAIVVLRTSACGRVFPPWAGCDAEPWRGHENVRLPFRCIHILAALRQIANAWSLLNQYHIIGDGVTPDTGHRQLWIRARIRASGVPIQLARFVLKIVLLHDTRYERGDIEVATNFIRAALLVPLSAWSLNHQYYTSGSDPPPRSVQRGVPCLEKSGGAYDPSNKGGLHRAKSNVFVPVMGNLRRAVTQVAQGRLCSTAPGDVAAPGDVELSEAKADGAAT